MKSLKKSSKLRDALLPAIIILANISLLLSLSQYKITGYAVSEVAQKTNLTLLAVCISVTLFLVVLELHIRKHNQK